MRRERLPRASADERERRATPRRRRPRDGGTAQAPRGARGASPSRGGAPIRPEEIDVANDDDDDDDDDLAGDLDGAEDAKPPPEDAAMRGAMLTIFVQLPGGKRVPCACREGAPFEKILANFLRHGRGSAIGAGESGKIGDAPRLVFDADAVDLRTTTPRDLEMEDEDVVDVS